MCGHVRDTVDANPLTVVAAPPADIMPVTPLPVVAANEVAVIAPAPYGMRHAVAWVCT